MTHASMPLRQPPFLVGRDRELALLRMRLTEMLKGSGRLILVGGEAGIGKTTLVRWLTDEALCQGALVLSGGSYDLTATPPYGPWYDAFSCYQAIAEMSLPSLLTATNQTDPQMWFELVRSCLAGLAVDQPLVVVLEDLHWSDPASLDLLRHVARRVDGLPILLVGTYRDDEITSAHHLFQLLPLLVREADAERLDLRRLNRDAIQQAVAGRYRLAAADQRRLVDYLTRNSDGNPLFFSELLRTFEADQVLRPNGEMWTLTELRNPLLPPLLRQIIDRRLARLHRTTRDALAIAAIISDQPPLTLWSAVAGLTDEQLANVVADATEANVLVEFPGGSTLRFNHALVREAIHAGMALPLRRVGHCQVAEALLTGPHPDPDEVAYHFQQAGDRRAIEWFVRAGIRARRANAWITAADRFLTAATLLDGDDGHARERGWLLFLAGWLLRFTAGARAIDPLNEAERLASSADDPALAAYASYARGAIRCMRTDVRRGLRDLETGVEGIDRLIPNQPLLETEAQAMSVIERLLPASEREKPNRAASAAPHTGSTAQTTADPRPGALVNLQRGVLINHYNHSGRYQQVIALGVPFQEEARAALGPNYFETQECWASLHGLGHAYAALGNVDDARHAFALSRRGANAANDQAIVEMNLWSEQLMVLLPYLTDQPDERARLIADANRAWERCIGTTITVAGDPAPSELQSDLLEGRWEQARQLATDHLGAPWITLAQEAIVVLGVLDHRQGRPDAAWLSVGQLLTDGPATKPGNVCFVHAMTAIELAAELALDAGFLSEARRWIEMHGSWLDWSGATLWRADTQLLWARYCMLAGDGPRARQHAENARRLAGDPRRPLRIIAAQRLLGQLDIQVRRHLQAATRLDDAHALAVACVATWERALTEMAQAELHIAARNFTRARDLLERIRVVCASLKARPMLDRVAELDAKVDVIHTQADGLTEREVEVLRLIAAGASNRAIADTLFISHRTVERHIANIYLKIDAHNKAEATVYVLRHQLL